ncbi:MAG TPA: nuclear transport factor 2 family protein [Pyrinomonadaceae bacterium]|nr:nuclear transport factor 2 family protein [Pyrinomonadaceae bacterium]
MTFKTLVFSLFSFALGAALCAGTTPGTSTASSEVSTIEEDHRTGDREAIRAHLDKIFRAYVNKDLPTIRATHGEDWTGFTIGARSIIRGIGEYMQDAENATKSPFLIADYKISEIDFKFYGDVVLVPYVADIVAGSTLRLPGKFRSLDVYAKIDGKWNQVGSNIDLHPETLEAQRQQPRPLTPEQRQELLTAREATWRAFFSNDRALLDKIIPEETIAINAATGDWANRSGVLAEAAQFAQGGGKLVHLEFPKTEVQLYGDLAILYSSYRYDLNMQGKISTQSGRATEVFVRRNGVWVNPGWHMDSGH